MMPGAETVSVPARAAPPLLLFRAAGLRFALPISHAVEILRPLSLDPVPGAPGFVLGISIVRGLATPVVSLRGLLGAACEEPSRLILLRVGARRVALAVEGVEGISPIPGSVFSGAPPLLGRVASGALEAVAALDGELLIVLEAGKLLGEAPWGAA